MSQGLFLRPPYSTLVLRGRHFSYRRHCCGKPNTPLVYFACSLWREGWRLTVIACEVRWRCVFLWWWFCCRLLRDGFWSFIIKLFFSINIRLTGSSEKKIHFPGTQCETARTPVWLFGMVQCLRPQNVKHAHGAMVEPKRAVGPPCFQAAPRQSASNSHQWK